MERNWTLKNKLENFLVLVEYNAFATVIYSFDIQFISKKTFWDDASQVKLFYKFSG